MIQIAICDDENVIINQIEKIISDVCKKENIPTEIDVFYSGEELEREIQNGTKYDLLYLDIQMKGDNGITSAQNIRLIDEMVLIIYVSGYDKYLMELFKLDVFSFIKKPIEKSSFEKTFLEAHRKIGNKKFYFKYSYKSEEYKMPCNEISYFESSGRRILIHLRNGEVDCFNGKLNEVELNLSEGKIPFLRIHQSYLVNYHLIKSRSKTEVMMMNGKRLPISEDRQKSFSQKYGKLLGGELNV